MNVMLLTDVEGIAGVTDIAQMDRTAPLYESTREALIHSINLAVETAFEAGADSVYYLDGHAGGGNVYEAQVDARAVKVTISEWETLLSEGNIDCQIEIGCHARAGTIGGFLDHTLSSKAFFSHRVNGVEMSELALHALICGAYNVPIVACTGDEVACKQAREYIPEIYTGAVKWATERNKATDYENADNILVSTVKTALDHYQDVPPYKVAQPATIELTYYRTDWCESAYKNCHDDVERVDARTLRRCVNAITHYAQLKFG